MIVSDEKLYIEHLLISFSLFEAGVAEAALASFGSFEGVGRSPFHAGIGSNDHLANAFTAFDSERGFAEINHYHLDFATIVGIDCSRSIDQCNTMFDSKSASGAELTFVAFGELDMHSGRDQQALHRLDHYRLVEPSSQIHSCGMLSGV